jgi:hypothetical protein
VSIVIHRDNEYGAAVKGNDDDGWNSNGIVLLLERRQNGGESSQDWDELFIVVESMSQAIWGGWPAVVVQIQCFNFDSRGEATERSVAERWNKGSELVLAPCEWSATRCGGVTMLVRGEVAPEKEKGWDNASWADANITGLKIKKSHTVDSAATNGRWRFKVTMS